MAREHFKTDTVNVDETSFKGATTRELELIEAMISGNKASVTLPLEKRMASDGLTADKVFLPSPSRYSEEWNAKSAGLVKTHKTEPIDDFASILRLLAIPVVLIFGVSAIAHKDANLFFFGIFMMTALSTFVYFAVRASKKENEEFRIERIYDNSSYRSAFAFTENAIYVAIDHVGTQGIKVQRLRYVDIQEAVLVTEFGDNPVVKIFDGKGIEYAIVRPESEQGEGARELLELIKTRTQAEV
ncbi:hypothetical protein [Mesorhizobium sp. SP-1A]|uniref:hypothetical protein n=1 Tax=Mesorhizobium sp. SP-1A TaxID=3077840 RepID=UPI0028F6EA12|nr:hypothetical protein [Mesorhizobium sp. SP-1A]